MKKIIRAFVVDDSNLARKAIIDGLNHYPNIEVVGYAINALDAKNKLKVLKPDVMTCDVQMPGMNGLDFLRQLLPENPLPVVVVSALNIGVFDALHAGAVDFVRKPDGTQSTEMFISSLAQKVMVAASAKVRRPVVTQNRWCPLRRLGTRPPGGRSSGSEPPPAAPRRRSRL